MLCWIGSRVMLKPSEAEGSGPGFSRDHPDIGDILVSVKLGLPVGDSLSPLAKLTSRFRLQTQKSLPGHLTFFDFIAGRTCWDKTPAQKSCYTALEGVLCRSLCTGKHSCRQRGPLQRKRSSHDFSTKLPTRAGCSPDSAYEVRRTRLLPVSQKVRLLKKPCRLPGPTSRGHNAVRCSRSTNQRPINSSLAP